MTNRLCYGLAIAVVAGCAQVGPADAAFGQATDQDPVLQDAPSASDRAGADGFAEVDLNNDGRLTLEEMIKEVERQNPDVSKAGLEKLASGFIAMVDTDGDAEISELEFALAEHRSSVSACEQCE